MSTQSDAVPPKHNKGKKGPNITFASGGYQQSGKNLPNSATPFGNSSASNPPNVDWNEFQRQFQDPVFSSNNRGNSKSKSTFNFSNCKVGNIVKTNKPVKIENKYETYEKGAVKEDLTIKGGNFPQANFGGDAKYNNEASNINAGTAAVDQPAGSGFVEIDNYPPPFSPEQYLVKLLRSGITSDALQSLLEKKYPLINLAHIIPKDNSKQERMIDALLTIAD